MDVGQGSYLHLCYHSDIISSMKIGVMYTRVSTKEQADDHTSLDTQRKECLAASRKNDVQIPDSNIFEERGESAKFADRTELQGLLRFVQRNKSKVEVLYIWKIDRLSRNLGDYYGIKVALAKYGVRIVSVTEPIDDDPVGRFLEAILAAAAQFDNEIRSLRTITGMRYRVQQGKWPHSAPIGYRKIDGRVMPDDKYADEVADVLIKFSENKFGLAESARYAYSLGIMTNSGKPKSVEAMKKILQNYIYAGFTRNKLSQKMYRGRHKPLVDEVVIRRNIERIHDATRTNIMHGDDLFPLRGALLCSSCKNLLTASISRGVGGSYPLYHCNKATCRKKVTGKKASGRAEIIHKEFRELLEHLRPLDESVARLFKHHVLEAWNDEYGHAVENAKNIRDQISQYEELRHSTMQKYIADKITEADKNAQLHIIDIKIENLKDEQVETEDYALQRETIIDDAMTFISAPDIFWNSANTTIRQDIQRLLFPSGLVYDFQTGFGTVKLSETTSVITNKKDLSNNDKSHLVTPRRIELLLPG